MLATIVSTEPEIDQIIELSLNNSKETITTQEKEKEGFISWNYSPTLLRQMHQLSPSVIIKDSNVLAGYALVAFKEASLFHEDLKAMVAQLDQLHYNNKRLSDYRYYVMGQICIHKAYRGKGLFALLYQKHKELFQGRFDFVITEISSSNLRSLKAHEKIGFKTIFTYSDSMDEWKVVLWEWS